MKQQPLTRNRTGPETVTVDVVNRDYFFDREAAQAFINFGLEPVLPSLPGAVSFACFGGEQGFLAGTVATAVAASGRMVSPLVVDNDPIALREASQQGLSTKRAEVSLVAIEDCDLVIMRSLNHTRDLATQQRILESAAFALKPSGYLISQILCGPTSAYCDLVSDLMSLPALRAETIQPNALHITCEATFGVLLIRAGFSTLQVAGYAPAIEVHPKHLWSRYNASACELALTRSDHGAMRALDEREREYLREANCAIADFLEQAEPAEEEVIRAVGSSYSLKLSFPIFRARRYAQ